MVEAVDLPVLGVEQLAPVEVGNCSVPAEAHRVLECIAELTAVDQQLLRHAAADDAGAANLAAFADRYTRTVSGCATAGGHAAGPGADGEQVKIVGRHRQIPLKRTNMKCLSLTQMAMEATRGKALDRDFRRG